MKVSSNNCIFPYHWNVDEKERDVTCIRVYGIDVNNKTSCLRIDDFTPYVYIELPTNIEWTPSKAQLVGNKIDEILGNKRPIKKVLMNKKLILYTSMGFIIGLCISIFIIFIRINLGRKNH